MGFNFAASAVPPDILLRAKAGLPLDPTLTDDQVSQMASQALAAPVPQPQPQPQDQNQAQSELPDIHVSPMETFMSMLFDGGSPADAAQRVRAIKLKNLQDQMALAQGQRAFQAIGQLPADQQLAIFLNGGKSGEELATREFRPQTLSGGQTLVNGPGGKAMFAPLAGLLPGSNEPYAIGQGADGSIGYHPLGGSQPAGVKVEGGVGYDSGTGETKFTYETPQALKPGEKLHAFTPAVAGPGAPAQASSAAPQGGAAPAGFVGQNGTLDPHAFFTQFWLPHEGALNGADLNGAPSKYGINQSANPGVDVPKLTPAQAEQVFTQKYFGPSGAAQMPPALALVHADTYGINPKMAQTFLQQSGGDPTKYIDLRQAWMDKIAANNPQAAKYVRPWAMRNADLRALVGQMGQGGQATQPQGAFQGSDRVVGEGAPAYRPLTDPTQRAAAGINPNDHGSYILTPEGPKKVADDPYGPDWAKGTRQQFLESEPYKQNNAAASALQALQHNIGQMTGPAAYTLLDTMARTINPGAVARQGTISAIEDMMGLPAHVVGALQNIQGKGKIPLQTQQQILDAVTPFAQAHWDQANAIAAANSDLAQRHGASPDDVIAPIGERPAPMKVGPVPPPQARQPNTIYQTPKGLALYLGNGQWHKLP